MQYYTIKGTDIVLVEIQETLRDINTGDKVVLPKKYQEKKQTPFHESVWRDRVSGNRIIYDANHRRFVGVGGDIHVNEFFNNRDRFASDLPADTFADQLKGLLLDHPGEPIIFTYDDGQFTASLFNATLKEITVTENEPDDALEEVAVRVEEMNE